MRAVGHCNTKFACSRTDETSYVGLSGENPSLWTSVLEQDPVADAIPKAYNTLALVWILSGLFERRKSLVNINDRI